MPRHYEATETRRRQVADAALSDTLRPDLDTPAMCLLIQGTLLTFAMDASLRSGDSDLHARIDHAWATLTAVLFAP